MKVYKTKARKFSGSDFREVHQKVLGLYNVLKKKKKKFFSVYFGTICLKSKTGEIE